VMELEQDLKVANVICMNGRRHVSSSKNEVSRDLVVNVKSKKKQALLVNKFSCLIIVCGIDWIILVNGDWRQTLHVNH
jgi:hypothetical protein